VSLSSIRAREEAATPGPWGWTGNLKLRWIELSALHSGRLGVMRFERWGMTGAQPVFLDTESRSRGMGAVTTVKASDVPIFEVCRDAISAADPRVYRQDILGLRHPDAAFIAHARQDIPLLIAVAEAARDLIAAGCWGHSEHSAERCRAGRLREAVEALEALP
jgi:hypothetical protein